EVVIPRFGGALTMLDGRPGAEGGAGMDQDMGGGMPSGGGGGMSSGGGRPAASRAPSKAELDDDIPF
ncbi:MAG: single-stranded DNA-binding protein, partial [Alphaproteobacteria bacterium]|nr:single-stranded DNA-binding protein [Alphaproteobacteria bacterium]